jgi:hypothetical protein
LPGLLDYRSKLHGDMLVKPGLFDCVQKPVSLRELETVVAGSLNPVSAYTALHAVADNAGSVRLEDLH